MSLRDWVRDRLPDAYTESEDGYDGLFSYAAEYHAFTHGVYDGMKTWGVRPGDIPDNRDVRAEPHYFKGGYVIGTLLQFGLPTILLASIAILATVFLPV